MQKFKIGDKIKYKKDTIDNRPGPDKGNDTPNKYTILAINPIDGIGYIYPLDNPRKISGADYHNKEGSWTWKILPSQAELLKLPKPPKQTLSNLNSIKKALKV